MLFCNKSLDYTKKTSTKHKHNLGQFFTPNTLTKYLLSTLPNSRKKVQILEPSCGSGEFIKEIKNKYKNSIITGIEIEKDLYQYCNKEYTNIIHTDFLKYNTNERFDYIIGNPPYFEMKLNKDLRKDYNQIISGRLNIYSVFIYKSINLLKQNGILSFVLSSSLLNGSYYQKLRQFIIQHCDILNIEYVDSKEFIDTKIDLIIFTIKKTKNKSKFIIRKNNILLFSPDYTKINNLYKNTISIHDLNCNVKTGSITWNKHKESLSDNKKDKLLIYSHNLKDNKLVMITHNTKKQYIKTDKYIEGPCILINRIVGTKKSINIKPVYIKNNMKFLAENHVNVITGPNLDIIYKSLTDKELNNTIRLLTGNTQLSKNELLHLIPIKK